MAESLSAIITVTRPCTCGAARWFLCTDACPSWDVQAEYACPAFDGIDKVPHPDAVVHVERLHPGMYLRYINLGGAHQQRIEQARALVVP